MRRDIVFLAGWRFGSQPELTAVELPRFGKGKPGAEPAPLQGDAIHRRDWRDASDRVDRGVGMVAHGPSVRVAA